MGRIWQEKVAGLPYDAGAPEWPAFTSEARYADRRRHPALAAQAGTLLRARETPETAEATRSDSEDDDGRLDLQPDYHADSFQVAAVERQDQAASDTKSSSSSGGGEDNRSGGEGVSEVEPMDIDDMYI